MKTNQNYFLISIIFILFAVSCKSKVYNLGTFDTKAFKSDRAACKQIRVGMIEQLKSLKSEILGMNENQILESFGRYDFQILNRRNEKVFVYYLEMGPQCLNIQNETKSLSMVLRFNAASLVKEINFTEGRPLEVD